MKKICALLTALGTLGFNAPASGQVPEDILVYKFSRSRTWQQYEARPDFTDVLKGRNVLGGVSADNSFWVVDRANKKIAEIRYFVRYVDDVKQKLFDVYEYSYSELGTDPAAYSDDATGNEDQFMDAMSVPSGKVNVNNLSFRQSFSWDENDVDYNAQGGEVWDLVGKTGPVVLVRNTPAIAHVSRRLAGFFQRIYRFDGRADDDEPSYYGRADSGPQSANLDVVLTVRVRNTSVSGQTANTLDNGVAAVVAVVEALGYDYDEFGIF